MKLAQKHRPIEISKKHKLHYRIETGRSESYNWRSRVRWYPAGWKINNQTLGRLFSRLHYLGCHSPAPVQKKWFVVYNRFEEKYFATKGKASSRYRENNTAYKWL